MEKKKVLGVRIEYSSSKSSLTRTKFQAKYIVAKDFLSETFFSSPELRKALNKQAQGNPKSLIEKDFGEIILSYNHLTRRATWGQYFPAGRDSRFSGKGIASDLEELAIMKLQEKFPKLRKLKHRKHSSPLIDSVFGVDKAWADREIQLKRRGIENPYRSYTPETALRKIRFNKAMARFKPKKPK